MGCIARILIYGDIHLNSKNYGAHVNYAEESLSLFRKITKAAEDNQATHLIGLGDLTFGRFHTLEYRAAVEAELIKQYKLVNGNRYELKGNHDSASYGMTEYEYYIEKGYIKPSCNMTIGNVHITMVDYNQEKIGVPNIGDPNNSINVLLAHNYFKFKDTQLPNFGKAIELDDFTKWYGIDFLISGHIHLQNKFEGLMIRTEADNQTHGHRVLVQYPGCLSRPSYIEDHMDLVGNLILLEIQDDGQMMYNVLDVELPKIEESFNISQKQAEKETTQRKEQRVDISDIIERLNSHNRTIGDPEDIIRSLNGVDDKYKKKAIELLRSGMA